MTTFYASATDECGDYVSLEVSAESKAEAWEYLEEQYPDCRIIQVLSPEQMQELEAHRYARLARQQEYDNYDQDY